MPDPPLVVPVILTNGALHFAEVAPDATTQDVIDVLVANTDVTTEALGDAEDDGWALQTVRVEQPGRTWEEEELEALGDGAWGRPAS